MRTLRDIGLSFNPFQLKTVYDYADLKRFPFLITESQKNVESFFKTSLSSPTDIPAYYLIIGKRGIGKTSTLLWLYGQIIENPKPHIIGRYEKSVKGMGNLSTLAMKLLPDKGNIYREGTEKTLRDFLKGKKYYWFIDIPDKITRKDLGILADGLEILMGFKNINIFIAMNPEHYRKMTDISLILGKFTLVQLKPFSLDETKKLIESRLKACATSSTPKIFSDEAIERIYKVSGGIPRNVLTICDFLLQRFLNTNLEIIDIDFLTKEWGPDLAKKIIEDRVISEVEQKKLYKLFSFIVSEFKGKVYKQELLVSQVKETLGWSRNTTLSNLKKLEKIGLIKRRKSEEDGWTKVIEVMV